MSNSGRCKVVQLSASGWIMKVMGATGMCDACVWRMRSVCVYVGGTRTCT